MVADTRWLILTWKCCIEASGDDSKVFSEYASYSTSCAARPSCSSLGSSCWDLRGSDDECCMELLRADEKWVRDLQLAAEVIPMRIMSFSTSSGVRPGFLIFGSSVFDLRIVSN
jgi:hypothetical protein